MRQPYLVIREDDGSLARLLRPLAEAAPRSWIVRTPRQSDACIRLLAAGHPAVLAVKAGRDLVGELTLVERVHALCPEVPIVVVSDLESPALASLAWHLGASFVFMPSVPHDQLLPVLSGLMDRTFEPLRVSRDRPAVPPAKPTTGPGTLDLGADDDD